MNASEMVKKLEWLDYTVYPIDYTKKTIRD